MLMKEKFNEMFDRKMDSNFWIDNEVIPEDIRKEYYRLLNAFIEFIEKDYKKRNTDSSNKITHDKILIYGYDLRTLKSITSNDEQENLIFNDSVSFIFIFVRNYFDFLKSNHECINLMQFIYRIVDNQ